MRARVLIGIALAAAFAACAADQTTATVEELYVVWADRLNLRVRPSLKGKIVTVLVRGDELTNLGKEVEYADGFWWRHVRVGENEGWVADKYVLPAPVYGAFKKADERGKAGDKEGMLATLADGLKTPEISDGFINVSPEGNKVFVDLGWRWAAENGYLGRSRRSDFKPVAYFENEAGLRDFTVYELYGPGLWYGGERYYLYVGLKPEEEWPRLPILRILDTETLKETKLGECGIGYESREYELAGPYIVWSSREDIPSGAVVHPEYGDMESKPVVMAFNTETKEKSPVLEAAMDTMNPESVGCYPCGGIYFFEVKLVPVGAVPAVIKESALYKKYRDGFGYVWSETQA